ncbi:PepSY-associated TM helix domain-containing protein [Thauera linaloolentis]|uniref:PepSY-associated TM helix n=1 Tax=Thauera linaloolentis (strain DSM 12138 / JCM 21573 / CCUG 41526 / CIP 105981 / IAM 15112 / NBRC 102519 / 47Lol) TaxID=1123367 RepID=N6Z613_THAL4|nr:PepSY-associated TM helix domain-containing protein [Thauera linaloolentis]ENO89967.1 pepSY-associated TM helix [Thauera linaloolentis 47Lol = DSM 12138]MCM8566606.1 PepSY domain-containing protein [Thauera linaloolentis]
MKIRNDIIKVYKDVHIWVGIISGLMLFIAFYAGAITMFEKPLERWATPPSALAPPPPIERTEALLQAVFASHPQAAKHYLVVVRPSAEAPARVIWREPGKTRREFTEYGASFAADGSLQVEKLAKAPVAQLVDTLHQLVGLPFPDAVARQIMGAVALMYAVALVSGLIIVLPTLVKDFLALRIGKNIKRMWMDVHNALGIVSLPFHLVMALTSVVFAFHTPFYAVQEKVVYPHGLPWGQHEPAPLPGPDEYPLPADALLRSVEAQLPGFEVYSFIFREDQGQLEASVTGLDVRHGTRGRTQASTHLNPYTGEVDPHDLPGRMESWDAAVNAFFMLHFGSYGGNAMRWLYLVMGLAGALLFYTGNLLWIESRRRKQRDGLVPAQKRSAQVLGCLTVGVSLGCVIGISATLAATKWLPGRVDDVALWHQGLYYAFFAAAVAWAFARGAARGADELLRLAALASLLVPLGSLAGVWGIGGTWNHPGAGFAVDAVALAAVPVFLMLARYTRKRMADGHTDSVWSTAGGSADPAAEGADARAVT